MLESSLKDAQKTKNDVEVGVTDLDKRQSRKIEELEDAIDFVEDRTNDKIEFLFNNEDRTNEASPQNEE